MRTAFFLLTNYFGVAADRGSLQDRLTALQETTAQLRELIDRLATVQFQPGSGPLSSSSSPSSNDLAGSIGSLVGGGGDEGNAAAAAAAASSANVASELAGEINQILREEEDELELLREETADLRSGRPGSEAEHRKTRLREGVGRLEEELKACRASFRKAQLSARRNLAAAQKQERDLLLASLTAMKPGSSPTSSEKNDTNAQQQHEKHTELFSPRERRRLAAKAKAQGQNNVVTASSDVTEALRRTHSLIAGEVAKSAFAAQTLAESTAALKELQSNYEGLDGLLARSRELVGTLLTSQKSDTWYLRTSLYVLFCTLCWLVFRRWLYGPLWWLVWFPLRTGLRTGKGVTSWAMSGGESGARMEVPVDDTRGEGRTIVRVGQEGAVPTVMVGREERGRGDEKGEESMVESVGRMVEDSLRGKDGLEEALNVSEEVDQPNPMKRMWEEEGVGEAEGIVVGEGMARDEL
ncbi:hypothetical protein QBC47DRAFT_453941 [Echria macrotheca]|uniref:Sec20 C-terminal domain-containing protein n=1 Tax=Echria macrotheca TaxID=438768 RepID=A0AAJ0F8U2_9PEZI|nr:hypothetical protein QBC47DRAFT_453941 [Echria macrotheca]